MYTPRGSLTRADSGFALAIHGGAGTLRPDEAARSRAPSYHRGLRRALSIGRDILATGGNALDAVTQAVAALEDNPLFNAGRGSVFTIAGTQEMDASVMDGRDHGAGAVAGILGLRNPISGARAVMEHSHHVLLIGEGALAFCREQHVAFAEPGYFRTDERWRELQAALAERPPAAAQTGTVGAVARDREGNLAAATSTGGMTGKTPGRVGDSPIIGAGTMPTTQPARCRRPAMASSSSAMAPPSRSPLDCAIAVSRCTRPAMR